MALTFVVRFCGKYRLVEKKSKRQIRRERKREEDKAKCETLFVLWCEGD